MHSSTAGQNVGAGRHLIKELKNGWQMIIFLNNVIYWVKNWKSFPHSYLIIRKNKKPRQMLRFRFEIIDNCVDHICLWRAQTIAKTCYILYNIHKWYNIYHSFISIKISMQYRNTYLGISVIFFRTAISFIIRIL